MKLTEHVCEDFSKDKDMFDFSNFSTKSKYYGKSNKLVVGKMRDEAAGVAIKEFVGARQNIYYSLVGDNSEHKKVMEANKIVVAKISHNEYKDFLTE